MYTLFDLESAPPAPNGMLLDGDGQPLELATLWPAAELTALVFARHCG